MRLTYLRIGLVTGLGGILALITSIVAGALVVRPLMGTLPYGPQLTALSLIIAVLLFSAAAVRLTRVEGPTALAVALGVGAVTALLLWRAGNSSSLAGDQLAVGWQAMGLCLITAAVPGLSRLRAGWGALSAVGLVVLAGILFAAHGAAPFLIRNVEFRNGDITLRGTLTVPMPCANAACPALVIVPGSGPQNRDGSVGRNQPYRQLAEYLSRQGIAALRYDKRGVGQSQGKLEKAGLYDLAADAESAFVFLRAQPVVDPARTFLLGHSYGGKEATIVASHQPQAAGLILLAAVASREPDNLRRQQQTVLHLSETGDENTQKQLAAFDEWMEGVRSGRLVETEDYFGDPGIPEPYRSAQKTNPLPPRYLKEAMEYDETATLASLRMPVLVLSGENDWIVRPSETGQLDAALARGHNPDFQVLVLPGLDHRFSEVTSVQASFEMTRHPEKFYQDNAYPVPDDVLGLILSWARKRVS